MRDHITKHTGLFYEKLKTEYTHAGAMFQLHGLYKLMEGYLWEFLQQTIGSWAIDNHSFDAYDESLELKWVNKSWAPLPYQLEKLAEYGFKRLYVNYEDGTARSYYRLPEDKWGTCSNINGKRE